MFCTFHLPQSWAIAVPTRRSVHKHYLQHTLHIIIDARCKWALSIYRAPVGLPFNIQPTPYPAWVYRQHYQCSRKVSKLKKIVQSSNHETQRKPPRILLIALCLFSLFPNNPFIVARCCFFVVRGRIPFIGLSGLVNGLDWEVGFANVGKADNDGLCKSSPCEFRSFGIASGATYIESRAWEVDVFGVEASEEMGDGSELAERFGGKVGVSGQEAYAESIARVAASSLLKVLIGRLEDLGGVCGRFWLAGSSMILG